MVSMLSLPKYCLLWNDEEDKTNDERLIFFIFFEGLLLMGFSFFSFLGGGMTFWLMFLHWFAKCPCFPQILHKSYFSHSWDCIDFLASFDKFLLVYIQPLTLSIPCFCIMAKVSFLSQDSKSFGIGLVIVGISCIFPLLLLCSANLLLKLLVLPT